MDEKKIGCLEDEALKRKERLKSLKRKQDSENRSDADKCQESLPKPKFRSYRPQDESLKESILPNAEPGDVTSEVKNQLDAANTKAVKNLCAVSWLFYCLSPTSLTDVSDPAKGSEMRSERWESHGRELYTENYKNNIFTMNSDIVGKKVVIEELDITNLAPRKPDWDLKRDVAKKLEKLERRTQKAIAELIWERMKEGQDDNIGAMVTLAMTESTANV